MKRHRLACNEELARPARLQAIAGIVEDQGEPWVSVPPWREVRGFFFSDSRARHSDCKISGQHWLPCGPKLLSAAGAVKSDKADGPAPVGLLVG